MESLKVRDCMSVQPAKISANASILAALRVILNTQQSAAAVVDNKDCLIGILSEADCIAGTFGCGFYDQDIAIVSDKMSTTVSTVSPETRVLASVDLFLKDNRRILPVTEGKKLVGMLSRENILRALLNECDHPTHHADTTRALYQIQAVTG